MYTITDYEQMHTQLVTMRLSDIDLNRFQWPDDVPDHIRTVIRSAAYKLLPWEQLQGVVRLAMVNKNVTLKFEQRLQ